MVGADKKHLLDRSRRTVKTLEPRLRGVLDLETARVPFTNFDAAGHNTAHLWTTTQDRVADIIKPLQPSMLAFHPSELHLFGLYTRVGSFVTSEGPWGGGL